MRRLLLCIAVFISLTAGAVPASAWEFFLKGEAEWRYRYISRTGPADLFGNALIAQSTPNNGTSIGLAGPQANAIRLEGYSSKGSDAAYAEQRLFLYPEVRVNPAVRLKAAMSFQGNVNANYQGGGPNWVTNPHYSGWILVDSRDLFADTGLAVPVLRAFWGTMQTPWGTLVIGTRPAGFGMGWVLHHDDCYARSLSLIVPYGPLSFVFSQYLHSSVEYTDPNDDRNTRQSPYTVASATDQNEVAPINTAVACLYRAGAIDTGVLVYVLGHGGKHGSKHAGGVYQDDVSGQGLVRLFSGPALNGLPIYLGSSHLIMGICYAQYCNGNFFFSSEYDFSQFNFGRNGGRSISGFGQAWAIETGLLAGPAKVSLAHFFRSGHDRRGGTFNLGSATGYVPAQNAYAYDHFDFFFARLLGGGDSPITPYCYLLGLYGTGNNGYTNSGQAIYGDVVAYAARLDYAVAANLNVFTSLIHAKRASATGTPQGLYNGSWAPGVVTNQASSPGNGGGIGGTPSTDVPTPNVPVTDLGWELDAGFHWKILEGVTWKTLFAYWQPGAWFKWAYRDLTISDPTNGNYGVVNPGRSIHTIMGVQSSILMEF